jgi:hypothetical protein
VTRPTKTRLDRYRADLFDVPAGIWTSNDNGQISCEKCVPYYGRIAWRKMTDAEVLAFRNEVADCVAPNEPTCERCRGMQRRAAEQAIADANAAYVGVAI